MVISLCSSCNWSDASKVEFCPSCGTKDLKRTVSRGRGRVESFTVVRYPPSGFEAEAPYVVAIVRLDEGPVVIAKLSAAMPEIEIGSEVSLTNAQGP